VAKLNISELTSSLEVLLTSEAGDKVSAKENVHFHHGQAAGTVVCIRPDVTKQTIDGIGTSFTESSAFVLAHLEPERRHEVMQGIFGESGANFTLTRTPIGACDFSVEGRYSCADVFNDTPLKHFNISRDKSGFDDEHYPGISDSSFGLLQMIQEALSIKAAQEDKRLRIIASAWTAPSWMKDIGDWFVPGTVENLFQGTGGSLKLEHYSTYADYLIKFIDAYKNEVVDIWGLTPVNEPCGNNGQWESMHFTPQAQHEFVKTYLGPKLKSGRYAEIKLLAYDHNRDQMEEWADAMLADPQSAEFVYGIAVHWYSSSCKVYDEIFRRVHEKYPEKTIIHTEGCIDDLGKEAPEGVTDPARFKESGWFDNDAFWWNRNATDWAYTASWPGVNPDDHPIYTPVHRYARDIIVGLDNWLSGWIDWNIVLDSKGGPNHVGNFCGAPIMIDTDTGQVHYTPLFHILKQFSRTIRPDDKAVQTDIRPVDMNADALHVCATINSGRILSVQLLNTSKKALDYSLQIGSRVANVDIPANSLQTIRVQL